MSPLVRASGIVLVLASVASFPRAAAADERGTPAAVTEWSPSPTTLAREMLVRARALDETALDDDRAAASIARDLPAKRAAALEARRLAESAPADEREGAVAHAEDLEADVLVSEAEVAAKRRAASSRRREARDLRARAIRLVKDPTAIAREVVTRPSRYSSDIF